MKAFGINLYSSMLDHLLSGSKKLKKSIPFFQTSIIDAKKVHAQKTGVIEIFTASDQWTNTGTSL